LPGVKRKGLLLFPEKEWLKSLQKNQDLQVHRKGKNKFMTNFERTIETKEEIP